MRTIPLSRGLEVIVDDADFEALSKFRWHVTCQGYAARNVQREDGRRTVVTMHRVLCGEPQGLHIDHANMNRLDNRRSNLRICTPGQNKMNGDGQKRRSYSRFKGVTWDKARGKWMAQIQAEGVHLMLGRFDSELDAATAYNAAALQHHGQFASPNAL